MGVLLFSGCAPLQIGSASRPAVQVGPADGDRPLVDVAGRLERVEGRVGTVEITLGKVAERVGTVEISVRRETATSRPVDQREAGNQRTGGWGVKVGNANVDIDGGALATVLAGLVVVVVAGRWVGKTVEALAKGSARAVKRRLRRSGGCGNKL